MGMRPGARGGGGVGLPPPLTPSEGGGGDCSKAKTPGTWRPCHSCSQTAEPDTGRRRGRLRVSPTEGRAAGRLEPKVHGVPLSLSLFSLFFHTDREKAQVHPLPREIAPWSPRSRILLYSVSLPPCFHTFLLLRFLPCR